MLEELDIEDGGILPLPNVDSATLKRILQWCTQHKDDPVKTDADEKSKENSMNTDVPLWDMDFLRVDQSKQRNPLLGTLMSSL